MKRFVLLTLLSLAGPGFAAAGPGVAAVSVSAAAPCSPRTPCACMPSPAEAAYWRERGAREAREERRLIRVVHVLSVVLALLWLLRVLIYG